MRRYSTCVALCECEAASARAHQTGLEVHWYGCSFTVMNTDACASIKA
jgi:hypothetical protein